MVDPMLLEEVQCFHRRIPPDFWCASKSEHEGPGLSENNLTSTQDKAKWRAQASTRVYDQVMWFRHASTGND